jgi:hypothetical protein
MKTLALAWTVGLAAEKPSPMEQSGGGAGTLPRHTDTTPSRSWPCLLSPQDDSL